MSGPSSKIGAVESAGWKLSEVRSICDVSCRLPTVISSFVRSMISVACVCVSPALGHCFALELEHSPVR